MTGEKIGRLTVIEKVDVHTSPCGRRHGRWRCVCECGNEVIVLGYNLRRKKTLSCGCLLKSRKNHVTHGLTDTRLYTVWKGMNTRCSNPNHKHYKDYGGRGIQVCEEWREDFAAFNRWACDNGYDETAKRGQCTIDRIDNNKGYCPENCRFTDSKTQCHNRRPVSKSLGDMNG